MMIRTAIHCHWTGVLLVLAGAFFLLDFGRVEAQDAKDFDTGPPPAWITRTATPAPESVSATSSGGQNLILLDKQLNGESDENYLHIGKQITSANGVQNGSQLQFNFDPAFEHLTIHFIRIIRDGTVLDRLEKNKFRVIQQETGLERHMYNGELSAVLFLEDVRVGDVIDYAYTIKGANPILKGRFVESFELTWTLPVQEQFYRLLWANGRNLTIKNHQTSLEPTVREIGTEKEYVWQLHDTPAVAMENSTPISFQNFAWVQLTEFSSWQEVVDWAIPLYHLPREALPADLRQKIESWQELKSWDAEVSQALRFVQDEVRYLGIEMGPRSQQPNDPGVVFDRRFGDCKDKVRLFCAILDAMGIEAHPVFVHAYNHKAAADWAPSPTAFDHVIAQIKLDDKTIWVDPTFSYQRGPLTNLYFPDYGCGLVIADGVRKLTMIPMQRTGLPVTSVYDTFRFSNYDSPAIYEVKTVKEGMDADIARAELAQASREDLEKAYLNHYAKLYPKIETAVPLEIQDDEANDIITIMQKYHVSDIWEQSENKQKWTMEFYPENIFRLTLKPETSLRSYPLALNYPRHEKQITRVILPQVFNITNQESSVDTQALRFRRAVTYSDRELTVKYDFETLTNMVSVADVPDYLKTLKKVRSLADFAIQHPSAQPGITFKNQPSEPNWLILTLGTFVTFLSIAAAFFVYYFRPVAPLPPLLSAPALAGIKGWLAVLAVVIILRPIFVLSFLVKTASNFSLDSWHLFNTPGTTAYQPGLIPLLIVELCVNIAMIVFGVLNIILFFQKRFAFRPIYLAILIFNFAFLIIDHLWYQVIASEQQMHANKAQQLAGALTYCVVWILYILQSKRVKNTFVK